MSVYGEQLHNYALVEDDRYYQRIIDEISASHDFYIEQKLRWVEALTQGCCEQANKYKVHTGSEAGGKNIFNVMETSDGFMRCCCAPGHTFKLHVVDVNAPMGSSGDWEVNENLPTLLEREGCCGKWLCCWTCNETCQNNAKVYPNTDPQQIKFDFEEKLCNGCKPEIVMYVSDCPNFNGERIPIAIIQGPSCFGGCSEACVDSHFNISQIDPNTMAPLSESQIGDIAKINKRHPEGCGELVTECCTDVDKFNINFQANYIYNRDPNFKLACMSALFYLDYMFFEMDNGMVECRDNALVITCCNLYCCGCICPCQCTLSGNNGE